MSTLQDGIELCGLTEGKVEAIAAHEHLPEMMASETAYYLVHAPNGMPILKRTICDDIAAARAAGSTARLRELMGVLRYFQKCHPRCRCATEQEIFKLSRMA